MSWSRKLIVGRRCRGCNSNRPLDAFSGDNGSCDKCLARYAERRAARKRGYTNKSAVGKPQWKPLWEFLRLPYAQPILATPSVVHHCEQGDDD